MRIWRSFVILFIITIFLFVACHSSDLPRCTLSLVSASGQSVKIGVELARTESQRDQGFMGRRHIPDGTGMLFIFDHDQILTFWMKNTPTPLSIAFIDHSGRIRDIVDMTPYSLADISSTVSVRYALEVPQGWFSRAGIETGDLLVLDLPTQ
jgi:uncharacterized protein